MTNAHAFHMIVVVGILIILYATQGANIYALLAVWHMAIAIWLKQK